MTKNQDTSILLFVKYPEKGKVKCRLSADLCQDIVQDSYKCFVYDTLTTVKKINASLFICFLPVDAKEKFQRWLGVNLQFMPQIGNDIGGRMMHCFEEDSKKRYSLGVTAQICQNTISNRRLTPQILRMQCLALRSMGGTISSDFEHRLLPIARSKKSLGAALRFFSRQ